jgi:hypothetical protein
MVNESATRGRGLTFVIVCVTLLIGFAAHLRSAMHYPMPFSDEPMFLLPARAFATHHTLTAPMLNAPNGLFWMPHGYTILLGSVFSFLPNTLGVARWTSFVAMAIAFCALAGSTRVVRSKFRPALLITCSAAFLSAGGIQAANVARMESIVVLAVAIVVWFMSRQRYLAAYGVLLLGCTVHAVLWPAAVTVLIAMFAFHLQIEVRRWEYAVLGVGILAAAAEAVYYAPNLHLAITQMGYQASRRGGASTHNATWAVGCVELVVALAVLLFCWRYRRALEDRPLITSAALVASLTIGIGAYLAYSYEFSYAVYNTGILPLLLVFAGFTILSDTELARPRVRSESIRVTPSRREAAVSVA